MHGVVSALHDAKTKRYKKYPSDESFAKNSRQTLQTTAFALFIPTRLTLNPAPNGSKVDNTTQHHLRSSSCPASPIFEEKTQQYTYTLRFTGTRYCVKIENFAAYLAAQIKLWCLCATRLFSPKCQYKCLPNEPQHPSALRYQAYITLPTVIIRDGRIVNFRFEANSKRIVIWSNNFESNSSNSTYHKSQRKFEKIVT